MWQLLIYKVTNSYISPILAFPRKASVIRVINVSSDPLCYHGYWYDRWGLVQNRVPVMDRCYVIAPPSQVGYHLGSH